MEKQGLIKINDKSLMDNHTGTFSVLFEPIGKNERQLETVRGRLTHQDVETTNTETQESPKKSSNF